MKKLLTILVLIMLIISFFQITSMYALYKERIQGEYSTLLGVWAIKVNGSDISSGGQDLTFTISDDQLQYVNSQYIEAGKIAPNGQAYFDIVIDPSTIYTDAEDTEHTVYNDVSIIYKIDVNSITDETAPATIELISVENYFGQGTDGQTNKTTNNDVYKDGNSYTSIIPVNLITQGYKNYVRLYFKWINVEDNNTTDSALAENVGATLGIPLQINLKQYTGEGLGDGS